MIWFLLMVFKVLGFKRIVYTCLITISILFGISIIYAHFSYLEEVIYLLYKFMIFRYFKIKTF